MTLEARNIYSLAHYNQSIKSCQSLIWRDLGWMVTTVLYLELTLLSKQKLFYYHLIYTIFFPLSNISGGYVYGKYIFESAFKWANYHAASSHPWVAHGLTVLFQRGTLSFSFALSFTCSLLSVCSHIHMPSMTDAVTLSDEIPIHTCINMAVVAKDGLYQFPMNMYLCNIGVSSKWERV